MSILPLLNDVIEHLRKDGFSVDVRCNDILSISVHKIEHPFAKYGVINIIYGQGKFWVMGHRRTYKLDEHESPAAPLSPKGLDCDFVEFEFEKVDESVKSRLLNFLKGD